MIQLAGPGGAGKTTIGAELADSLGCEFLDLDREFTRRLGDVDEFIAANGYDGYARANVTVYIQIIESAFDGVIALSSGFLLYDVNVHPGYADCTRGIARDPRALVLMPTVELESCVCETVRRQTTRGAGRTSASRAEVKIRDRFRRYMDLPNVKIETMCPIHVATMRIRAALR